MSHYKFYRSVPIKVSGKGKTLDSQWTLGMWEYTENRPVWGLMHYNQPTQMCYGLDYAKPQESIAKLEERNHPEKATLWYFDVGNEVTVELPHLVEAFKELDIWEL